MLEPLSLRLSACLILALGAAASAPAQTDVNLDETHIFFGAGCADCWPYTEGVLIPALRARGLAAEPVIHDYTAPGGRKLLLEYADRVALPRSISDSLYAFVPANGGVLVILGHVPQRLIDAALRSPARASRLVIWQPQLHGEPTVYRLWAWRGQVTTFPIAAPFEPSLAAALSAEGPAPVATMPYS